jgi:hypothetical protein
MILQSGERFCKFTIPGFLNSTAGLRTIASKTAKIIDNRRKSMFDDIDGNDTYARFCGIMDIMDDERFY